MTSTCSVSYTFSVQISERDEPVATNNSELPRLNFAALKYKLKLIPSLISTSSSFNSFNYSNIVRNLSTTNVRSSFAHSLQENHSIKHDRNTLPPTVHLNIVNNSSSNLVPIFTSFSSTKGNTIYDSDSMPN